ncbi:alpha/beta fold hydrolase [Kribbella sp. NPDC051718]|uniref:thioesterase II family protein n=1 Tax=Kribbella sp. NPDC051718 TaxID=3155168 RepID=UPI00341C03C8
MSITSDSPWFQSPTETTDQPRLRLFCFPHGGAGASVFRGWQKAAGPEIEVVPVQLPGRERRHTEPCITSITEISHQLVQPTIDFAGDVPYVFLGHSMGALIAYELCHQLRQVANPPALLAVTGAAAAHLPRRRPDVSRLPDQELRTHITTLNGTPAELLADKSWMDVLLPVMRADFGACETYRHVSRPPLDLPLIAFGGTDDPLATADEVERWGDLSTGRTVIRLLDGDHFFLFQHVEEIVETVFRTARESAS